MRFTVRALGLVIVDIHLDRATEDDEEDQTVYGPPFGFSGSGSSHIERADPHDTPTWIDMKPVDKR